MVEIKQVGGGDISDAMLFIISAICLLSLYAYLLSDSNAHVCRVEGDHVVCPPPGAVEQAEEAVKRSEECRSLQGPPSSEGPRGRDGCVFGVDCHPQGPPGRDTYDADEATFTCTQNADGTLDCKKKKKE